MRRDAWREFVDRPGGKLFAVLIAGAISMLIVLGCQYAKLSQAIERRLDAARPYPKIVDMHLAFSLPVSLGAKLHGFAPAAGSPECGPEPESASADFWIRALLSYTRAPCGTAAPHVHTGTGPL